MLLLEGKVTDLSISISTYRVIAIIIIMIIIIIIINPFFFYSSISIALIS